MQSTYLDALSCEQGQSMPSATSHCYARTVEKGRRKKRMATHVEIIKHRTSVLTLCGDAVRGRSRRAVKRRRRLARKDG